MLTNWPNMLMHVKLLHQSKGRDDFQMTPLRILDSLTEESFVILGNPDIFISEILPSLAVLYQGNKGSNARFLCLKILFDVTIILLSEPIENEQRLKALKFISNSAFFILSTHPWLKMKTQFLFTHYYNSRHSTSEDNATML